MDCTENNELINKLITEDRNVCEYEELMEELGKQI